MGGDWHREFLCPLKSNTQILAYHVRQLATENSAVVKYTKNERRNVYQASRLNLQADFVSAPPAVNRKQFPGSGAVRDLPLTSRTPSRQKPGKGRCCARRRGCCWPCGPPWSSWVWRRAGMTSGSLCGHCSLQRPRHQPSRCHRAERRPRPPRPGQGVPRDDIGNRLGPPRGDGQGKRRGKPPRR